MKFRALLTSFFLLIQLISPVKANAGVTWSVTSVKDTVYDGNVFNAQYDLDFARAAIFDNDPDEINFYMEFAQVPTVNMFNDGKDSWGFIGLDYDFDGTRDIRIVVRDVTLRTDLVGVRGIVEDTRTKTLLNCDVGVFTNIAEGRKWIGFEVSRKCISLPLTFDLFAYADYDPDGSKESFDYAPYPFLRVNLPGAETTSGNRTTESVPSGATHTLPSNIGNSSKESSNFTIAPSNLSSLSDLLLPSVVTVGCGDGSGTGWSVEGNLPQSLRELGFQSLIATNHHVIEDCLSTKSVRLVLSNGTTVSGQIVSWNETNDVAGVVTKTSVPSLQWIGSQPKQGWWVGVLGSPLGKSNVLTTGIVSSVNNSTKKFTLTAAINPGNSGGPVFDNTGRVLGLATSKAVLSDGQLAEGFGNAHGVPLLCSTIIICGVEVDPWNSKSKFTAGPTPEEVAAQKAAAAAAEAAAIAQAEAAAKAALEAKQRDEMKNQCIKFNGDLDVAIFNTKTALATFPNSANTFNSLLSNAPGSLNCDSISIATFDAEITSKRKLLTTLEIAITSAISTAQTNPVKRKTIVCIKGNLTKKVRGKNPKCPTGYKKKK